MTDNSSSPSNSWPLDQFVQDPGYLAYQEELRCLIFNTAQTAAPSRETSPAPGEDGPPGEDFEALAQTKAALSTGRRLAYLKNYVAEVAPWLDMFDSERAFTVQVPVLARRCPALLYAILALSARQMERKEAKQHSFDSLELYQEAIRLLNPLLQARDLTIIPICVILCCLEMMSASPQDWRRHLEGCAALFDAFDINGFSGGLLQAVFWCYIYAELSSLMELKALLCLSKNGSRLAPTRPPQPISSGSTNPQTCMQTTPSTYVPKSASSSLTGLATLSSAKATDATLPSLKDVGFGSGMTFRLGFKIGLPRFSLSR
ncbi:hypothetical protein QQX98_001501 [Neonectria punicea]|uniref:C6 transcription factor n=1 Tax=Neonectria punicea TaxID=979145 RepID=A0ABR1HN96_9HYPO